MPGHGSVPRAFREDAMWSVAVFAHNESSRIGRCLDSLVQDAPHIQAYVLINGSTDDTEAKVRAFAGQHPWVHPVTIETGCKCNAWNTFIHAVAPKSDAYFFLDGDCYVYPHGLARLAERLAADRSAYAAAAFPAVGRNREKWIAELLNGSLWGCLYGLSTEAVELIKNNEIRLPIGCIGDDSVLEYLLLTDFRGGKNDRHRHRIAPTPEAQFHHDVMSFFKIGDYVNYYRKQVRDSLRWLQCQILVGRLKREGIRAMPRSMEEVMCLEEIRQLRLRSGYAGFFDRLALQKAVFQARHS
jgi:glycosyltransferase involved in cell wall biosynthesis